MVRRLAQDWRGHKAGDVIDHFIDARWRDYAKDAGKTLEQFAPLVTNEKASKPKGGAK